MSAPQPQAVTYAVLAALLEQGKTIHILSCALTVVSLAGLGFSTALISGYGVPTLLGVAALLGAAETYLAIRVVFDAAIFRLAADEKAGWADIDGSLSKLKLVKPKGNFRSDGSRIQGSLGLLRRQGLATVLQLVLLFAAFAIQF